MKKIVRKKQKNVDENTQKMLDSAIKMMNEEPLIEPKKKSAIMQLQPNSIISEEQESSVVVQQSHRDMVSRLMEGVEKSIQNITQSRNDSNLPEGILDKLEKNGKNDNFD